MSFFFILSYILLPQVYCECGGKPCIFTGKIGGWVEYIDPGVAPYTIQSKTSIQVDATEVFVSISSYRDKLCPRTLYNAFIKAKNPSRVKIGVVQQNNEDVDIDCLEGYCELYQKNKNKLIEEGINLYDPKFPNSDCPFKENVIMRRIKDSDAKGPVFARALGSEMISEEAEFCMQIDSHMDFYPNWEVEMINMWKEINNEYGVLSTYVNDIGTYDAEVKGKGVNDRHEVPHLCMITWSGQGGMIRNWGTKCAVNLDKPKLTNGIWGAGLSFSKCHAERKTPYDPSLPYVFDGEEFSKAARLWTYGYDMYTPHRVYVFHDYHVSQTDANHFGWSRNQFSSAKEKEKQKNNNLRIGSDKDKDKDKDKDNGPVWRSGYANIPDSPVTAFTMSDAHNRLRNLLEIDQKNSGMKSSAAVPLSLSIQYHRFGLGDRRTLTQLIEFSGVNTREKSGGQEAKYCGNLQYVPFLEHPLGPDHIPSYDSNGRPLEEPDHGSIYYQHDGATSIRSIAQKEARAQTHTHAHGSIPSSSTGNSIQSVGESVMRNYQNYHKGSHWMSISMDILGVVLLIASLSYMFSIYKNKSTKTI